MINDLSWGLNWLKVSSKRRYRPPSIQDADYAVQDATCLLKMCSGRRVGGAWDLSRGADVTCTYRTVYRVWTGLEFSRGMLLKWKSVSLLAMY